jgi:hypothetical protein
MHTYIHKHRFQSVKLSPQDTQNDAINITNKNRPTRRSANITVIDFSQDDSCVDKIKQNLDQHSLQAEAIHMTARVHASSQNGLQVAAINRAAVRIYVCEREFVCVCEYVRVL